MASKLRPAEWLTAIGTIILFISTFGFWFNKPVEDLLRDIAPDAKFEPGASLGINLNVWDLPVARWLIYLALLSSAWLIVSALFSRNANGAVVLATPTVIFGLLASIALVYRLIDPPGSASVLSMYYMAVAGGLLMFAGACWSIRDETLPLGFEQAPEPELVHLDSAP